MGDIGAFEADDLKNLPTFRAAYSDRTALLMAKLAFRAYDKFDVDDTSWLAFSDTFRALGLSDVVALIDGDVGTAGFLVAGPDIIVIVFRGTEDELDWQTNVNAAWVVLQGGVRVHTGFFQAYWPIREALYKALGPLLQAKQRPVYITGHSLGGALATMATAELANHDIALVRDCIAACYTFGSPRVGDGSFDQYVTVPLYRVTNGVDIVPAVPPALLGYRHVGDTRYFGKLGVAPLRRSPNIFQKIYRTALGLLQLLRTHKLASIADHSMTVYIAKLAAWAQQTLEDALVRRAATADPEIKSTPPSH